MNGFAAAKPIRGKEFLFFAASLAATIGLFSVFRLLFLLRYPLEFAGVATSEVLRGFAHGVRFDGAIIGVFFAGILVLTHLPYLNNSRIYRWLWILLVQMVMVVLYVLELSDLLYYRYSQKHLSYEARVNFNSEMIPIVKTAFLDSPALCVAGLLGLAVLVGSTLYLARRLRVQETSPISIRRRALVYGLALPLMVVLARGGLQRVPLRMADSFVSNFRSVNILTLNGAYSALRAWDLRAAPRIMDATVAQEVTLGLLGLDSTRRIDPRYPIFRRTESSKGDTFRPYNVVVLLMESWTGKYTGLMGDTLGVTPQFNRLCSEGLGFNHFFASGYRTTSGTFCTLTGFPERTGLPTLRRPELGNNFGSLSRLLKERGYASVLVTGGILDFENLGMMFTHELFDKQISASDMADCGGEFKEWGYDDEFIFDRALTEFRAVSDKPFFGFVISVSTHAPGSSPDGSHDLLTESDHTDARYLNAYRYSDWALGQFFEKVRLESYFDRTLFIITGDHTHHTGLNVYENQQVPLLFYGPKLIEPAVRSVIGSQTDILPTVAEFMRLPYHAAMGRDLFSLADSNGFAFWITDDHLGWIEDKYLVIAGQEKRRPLVYDVSTGDYTHDIGERNPDLAERLKRRVQAYYQFSSDLLFENRIAPEIRWRDKNP